MKIILNMKDFGVMGIDANNYIVGDDIIKNTKKVSDDASCEPVEGSKDSVSITNPSFYMDFTQAMSELYRRFQKMELSGHRPAHTLEELIQRIEAVGKKWAKFINHIQFEKVTFKDDKK